MTPDEQARYERIVAQRNTRRALVSAEVRADWWRRTRNSGPLRLADVAVGPGREGVRR